MAFLTKKVKDTNIIGIDLGTTNTVAAMMINGIPSIIRNKKNRSTTPSVVNQQNKNKFIVGEDAKNLLEKDQYNTIHSSKRLIGRKMAEISTYANTLPYKTTESCNGDVWIKTDFGKFSPAQIGAKILGYVKKFTSEWLKGNKKDSGVQRAVVTVPAYFNDMQRQATKDAGRIAGLDVIRVINEPTAAALAYGLEKKTRGNVAVYDLGGGTFDISILELDNGVFHVKATNGDTFLGGEDFDGEFLKFLVNAFHQSEGIELKSPNALVKLKNAAEKAKKELSQKTQTKIVVENIIDGVDFDLNVSRNQLESVIKRVANRTIEPCKTALRDAGLQNKDINKVVLVGGMTRMPYIRSLVQDIFGIVPSHDINPDEAVAKGAAIQAGILSGDVKDAVLLDVIPLSLGIETVGGVFSKMVEKNTTIPFKQEETFTTSKDGQTEVDIRIYQGDRALVRENKELGKITLKNIPKAKKGEPRIKVIFTADANGLLRVKAEDEITKKAQGLEIKASSGLEESEIEKMIQEAKANEMLDKKQLQITDFKNKYRDRIEQFDKLKLKDDLRVELNRIRDEYLNKDEFDIEIGRRDVERWLSKCV
ncbi:HSP70 [Enterospora canceri]|uniref:HSP70 n=1 Tax=Enterospora canceri TaxID=1081671 RepID=A0A1Y1S4X5_9MICR|nr:HSP70 [Enterospora canceri]